MNRYLSRKFIVTAFFAVTGAIAIFTDKMSGNEYVALAALVIGAYGLSNVAAKKSDPED